MSLFLVPETKHLTIFNFIIILQLGLTRAS